MYIKSGRFLADKGQIVFPGPPTRSAFSFSYNPTTALPTTSTSTTTVAPPTPEPIDFDEEFNNLNDMWRSKSPTSSDMLSYKIQMFYIYITVTITSVLVLFMLGVFAYMCYKRKGFQSIDNQADIEQTRRQSSRRPRSQSQNYSKDLEANDNNPGRTLLR